MLTADAPSLAHDVDGVGGRRDVAAGGKANRQPAFFSDASAHDGRLGGTGKLPSLQARALASQGNSMVVVGEDIMLHGQAGTAQLSAVRISKQ